MHLHRVEAAGSVGPSAALISSLFRQVIGGYLIGGCHMLMSRLPGWENSVVGQHAVGVYRIV